MVRSSKKVIKRVIKRGTKPEVLRRKASRGDSDSATGRKSQRQIERSS